MSLIKKTDIKGILGNLGVLMHVPGVMALISLPISIIFHEYFAIIPLFITAFLSIAIGQLLRYVFPHVLPFRLCDGMVTAATCWIFCPIIGAVPLYWISTKLILLGQGNPALITFAQPINAIFESYSGFTTAGFSMTHTPSELPHCLQWWRSLMEWFGSLGFMIFVMSIMEPRSEDYQLFYSEVYEQKFAKNLRETAQAICTIYIGYTVFSILLFLAAGMPLWAAINHGMCGISTGGFTITDDGFASYSQTIHIVAMFVMALGATSFVVHYRAIYKRKPGELWRNLQTRIFYFFIVIGTLLLLAISFSSLNWVDSAFLWISSLGTCGYISTPVHNLSPMVKLFLMLAMFIGGCSGATSGGLKIRRIVHIWQGVRLRLQTIMRAKAGERKYISHSIELPKETKTTERLYEATILFAIWSGTLFIVFFLLDFFNHEVDSINILYDTTSALSNVGLSTGFVSEGLAPLSKIIVMFTIIMGRLEIIPMLILFIGWPFSVGKKKKKIHNY